LVIIKTSNEVDIDYIVNAHWPIVCACTRDLLNACLHILSAK